MTRPDPISAANPETNPEAEPTNIRLRLFGAVVAIVAGTSAILIAVLLLKGALA